MHEHCITKTIIVLSAIVMLAARNLTAGHEREPLFTDLTFTLNDGERLGVVGSNGTGKSTLLQTLHGQLPPIEGSVQAEGAIGYLDQVPDAEEMVATYVDRMTGGLLTTGRELEELYGQMGDPEVDNRVSLLQSIMDEQNGWDVMSRVEEVLTRLGIPADAMGRRFGEFSGGQQSRIMLAGQLIAKPDILLLDEPTNNLDQEAMEWLENYLRQYRGAVVVVSHDREFLESVSSIIELEGDGLEPSYYTGCYSEYMAEKKRRFKKLLLEYEAQQKQERALNEAIVARRQMSARFEGMGSSDFYRAKGKKVMSGALAMERRLERMKRRPEWLREHPEERPSLPFKLRGESQKGRRLIAATALQLGYGVQSPVITDATFTVKGRDRIAITGNNGAGKTTLLNAIAGDKSLVQDGHVEAFADFSYYTQSKMYDAAQQSKDTMVEWFRKLAGPMYEDEAASLLVWFGFDKKQIFRQPVRNMSPGELNKLNLLAMTSSGNELLLLDEPTNHLDFDALDVVENALGEFKGTVVTVSHDRKFLGNIACNRLLQVTNGRITERDA